MTARCQGPDLAALAAHQPMTSQGFPYPFPCETEATPVTLVARRGRPRRRPRSQPHVSVPNFVSSQLPLSRSLYLHSPRFTHLVLIPNAAVHP